MRLDIRHAVGLITFGILLSSCSIIGHRFGSTGTTSGDLSTTGNVTSSAKNNEIVADFRDPSTQERANGLHVANAEFNQSNKTKAKALVEATLGPDTFDRYRLADSAQGRFTSSDQQSLHILVDRKATAVEKKVTPSIIVIFQDDKPLTQFVPTNAAYSAVVSVFDIDNDGFHEVLLTGAAYQMGTQFVSADVYSFRNPSDILKQAIGVVYTNACDSSVTDIQTINASILSITPDMDELMAETYVVPCSTNNESQDSEPINKKAAR